MSEARMVTVRSSYTVTDTDRSPQVWQKIRNIQHCTDIRQLYCSLALHERNELAQVRKFAPLRCFLAVFSAAAQWTLPRRVVKTLLMMAAEPRQITLVPPLHV